MMNSENENKDQPVNRQQQPGDLSLKGYYAIAAISVTIGIVIVGILNPMFRIEIKNDNP